MIKRIAKWLNRSEHKRIEAESQVRNESDIELMRLLDVLADKDKQLSEQLDLYDTLLNGVPVMIWYIENVDKMGVCNKTCADFFGLDRPDQLSGASLYGLMAQEEADACVLNNEKVFNEYRTICSEEWVTRHDGVRRLWHITKTPRGNGNVKYAVCCGVDITDQREAEWYRDALLRTLPDIVFVHDSDGYYLDCYANQNENLLYPCEMIAGKHLSDCLSPKVVAECLSVFSKVLETGETGHVEYELLYGKEVRIFEARIVALDEDRLLSTVRDITDWKSAQEKIAKQLTAQQKALWQCEVSKDCPGSHDGSCRKTERIGDAMQEKLIKQLVKHEGERLFAYKCTAGKTTIGVGRNIDAEGGKGITQAESSILLSNDIAECTSDLQNLFSNAWDWFSENRKIALIDMRFGLGPNRFRGFEKMIAAVKRKDWADAGKEAMDSKWARKDVGKARSGLIYTQLVGG